MNDFIARFACRDMGLGISSTWVLPTNLASAAGKRLIGAYYTLGSASVESKTVPKTKRLPPYPAPVVLLAKLAVDRQYQGQRVGEKTLVHALRKAVELTDRGLPAIGVTVDVLNKDALTFYQAFEIFEAFTDNPMRLFVSMHVLKQI